MLNYSSIMEGFIFSLFSSSVTFCSSSSSSSSVVVLLKLSGRGFRIRVDIGSGGGGGGGVRSVAAAGVVGSLKKNFL